MFSDGLLDVPDAFQSAGEGHQVTLAEADIALVCLHGYPAFQEITRFFFRIETTSLAVHPAKPSNNNSFGLVPAFAPPNPSGPSIVIQWFEPALPANEIPLICFRYAFAVAIYFLLIFDVFYYKMIRVKNRFPKINILLLFPHKVIIIYKTFLK